MTLALLKAFITALSRELEERTALDPTLDARASETTR
jgi:hypothetical protein